MTPSFVDKYYGKVTNANVEGGASSNMSGIESAEKDSDTVGRLNENLSVRVFLGTTEIPVGGNGQFTASNTDAAAVANTVTVVCSVAVSEPLLGLPTATLKEDESNYLGINNLELLLQWNDMRNVFNISGSYLWQSSAGDVTNRLVISDSAKLNLKYMCINTLN